MASLHRLWMAVKALIQLGPLRMAENGWYRVGLQINAFANPKMPQNEPPYPVNFDLLPALPPVQASWDRGQALTEAAEIAVGMVRLFAGEAVALDLCPPLPLSPWSDYELGKASSGTEDIKFIWEPARF